jgi:hypothetical protein
LRYGGRVDRCRPCRCRPACGSFGWRVRRRNHSARGDGVAAAVGPRRSASLPDGEMPAARVTRSSAAAPSRVNCRAGRADPKRVRSR